MDDVPFKNLMLHAHGSAITVMSRRTLMKRIAARMSQDHSETLVELAKTDYVSTMTDVWSTKHHSYLGVSAHWLDENLQRRSRVLACPHFRNPHSGERIASSLQAIHDGHELGGDKLVSTTTDNASNMVNAFVYYGVVLEEDSDYDDDDSEDDQDEDEHEAMGVPETDPISQLPVHQRFVFYFSGGKHLIILH